MKAFLLAAGLGSRLRPFTNIWPKCLMPINGYPLLGYWLRILEELDVSEVMLNKHHHSESVDRFLECNDFWGGVKTVFEEELLGTAGTLRNNYNFLKGGSVLVAHADNFCCCDFSNFISYHCDKRPKETLITMMTFTTENPSLCGIVETDEKGIVRAFHEKVKDPHGNVANGAVYIMEPEVFDWLIDNPKATDLSLDVIPEFLGRIATWHNSNILKDIGSVGSLIDVQNDQCNNYRPNLNKEWHQSFLNSKIMRELDSCVKKI